MSGQVKNARGIDKFNGPQSLDQLPAKFRPKSLSDKEAREIASIKDVLNFYVLCIDGKQYSELSLVFAEDAIIDYRPPMGKSKGLAAIQNSIQFTLGDLPTQHALSSISVRISDDGNSAISISYMQAMHFGLAGSSLENEYAVGHVQYQDQWVKIGGSWKIKHRELLMMGPMIGNISIFKARRSKSSL